MPTITRRSTNQTPLIKTKLLSHSTLECKDLQATRRFYEEVLGLPVVQYAPGTMWVRLGSDHVYTVVETGREREMDLFNHNGLDVDSEEAVRAACEQLNAVKDRFGIRKIQKPRLEHGVYCFYFQDLDGNWWEILANSTSRGYSSFFDDPSVDITGMTEEQLKLRAPLTMPKA